MPGDIRGLCGFGQFFFHKDEMGAEEEEEKSKMAVEAPHNILRPFLLNRGKSEEQHGEEFVAECVSFFSESCVCIADFSYRRTEKVINI